MLTVRVTLDDVQPEIWRLLEIGGQRTLDEVHDALQVAMGWTDSHLHVFEHPDGRRWANPDLDMEGMDDDERTVTLGQVLGAGGLRYEYDFGDSWSHRLELVGTVDEDTATVAVRDGARSAPPEDSGGVPGYAELLETLADPAAEDHDDMVAWASSSRSPWAEDEPFDPETFDLDVVNRRLQQRFAPEVTRATWGDSLRQVVAGMTPGVQVAFGDRLAQAELERPFEVDSEQAADCVRPFAWLLDRVGEGLTLTSAGRLPPALVREASEALGWGERWIGTMNREDHVLPAADLRESATRTHLVRKHRGRLLLTRAGAAGRRDSTMLLRHLGERVLAVAAKGVGQEAAVLLLVDLAAGREPDRNELSARVAAGLQLLGYVAEDRRSPPSASSAFRVVSDVWGLLGMLGLVPQRFRNEAPGSRDLVRAVARLALREG